MKNSVLDHIAALESKLVKLEISPEQIDRIKNSVLSFKSFNKNGILIIRVQSCMLIMYY